MKKHRRLAGCVPVRFNSSEQASSEVLLISSRSQPSRLVFPKGGVKRGEDPKDAAQRETWEEAGVRGTILALLSPAKVQDGYDDDACFVDDDGSDAELNATGRRNSEEANRACRWFLLAVHHETEDFPEHGQRTKHWTPLDAALHLGNIRDATRNLLLQLDEYLQRNPVVGPAEGGQPLP